MSTLRAAVLLLAPLTVGCAGSLQRLTAMHVECAADDLDVTNDHVEAPRRVWDARCKSGGVYRCSALQSGRSQVVSCDDASARAITVEQR